MAKVVKPTPKEWVEVKKRLFKKYPQMRSWWKKSLTKAQRELERRTSERIKAIKTKRTRRTESRLKTAGLSEADIARLQGRK